LSFRFNCRLLRNNQIYPFFTGQFFKEDIFQFCYGRHGLFFVVQRSE